MESPWCRKSWKNYLIILITCAAVTILAFIFKPHDCRSTYGPPPYYYNTDLTLWMSLAEQPVKNLPGSILANRPLFAYLGWTFRQPMRLIFGDRTLSSATRASGEVKVSIATAAGLFLANSLCFALTGLLLYAFTVSVFQSYREGLLAALLWATSGYAYAWSYHPVNQMGGLVVLVAFSLGLMPLLRWNKFFPHLIFGLGSGTLLLMKAYYVLPLIYLVWGAMHRIRLIYLAVGLMMFFLPTIFWQWLYEWISGMPFVDYHLGTAGMGGFLLARLQNPAAFFAQFLMDIVQLPRVVFNACGLITTTAALGFFIAEDNWKKYPMFTRYAAIYAGLLLIFLSLSGFFIPRHGSDFFVLIYPAGAAFIISTLNKVQKRKLWIIILIAVYSLMTILSYTLPWLCAAEIL